MAEQPSGPQRVQPDRGPASARPRSDRSVLVVADDAPTERAWQQCGAGVGLVVRGAESGDAVRSVVRAAPPAAVVIDLALEVLDGWYVLADLGAHGARPVLVAIAADAGDAPRALALGADTVVASRADAVRAVADRLAACAR